MAFCRCPIVAMVIAVVISLRKQTEGVRIREVVGGVTELGTASNEQTFMSVKGDVPGRCLAECLNTKGCTGFNMKDDLVGRMTCDFKQGLPSGHEFVILPGVRFVSALKMAHNCAEHYDFFGHTTSGVYDININPNDDDEPRVFQVYCDMQTDGGKWMVLIRRKDASVNFDRSWDEYLSMFGDLEGNLWMGLEFMHLVTVEMGISYEMRVDLVSFPRRENDTFTGPVERGYAKYKTFYVDDATSFYKMHVKDFTGNWGDSMLGNDGSMFTANGTANDHDTLSGGNCAEFFAAPWWYSQGSDSRLTGTYGMIVPDIYGELNSIETLFYQGIMWRTHLGSDEHPQYVDLKIRPL